MSLHVSIEIWLEPDRDHNWSGTINGQLSTLRDMPFDTHDFCRSLTNMKKRTLCASLMVCAAVVQAQTTATYEVTFTSTWSSATHPTNFPSSPHYSGLIGGTHNSSATFWETGSTASLGIKQMAEFGSKLALQSEVQTAIADGTAERVLSGGGIGRSPGLTRMTFDVSEDFPLVTLTSMLAPSPDWFVGVNGQSLRSSTGWEDEIIVELFVYDAGTDSGSNYTSANQATSPQENIARMTDDPFVYNGEVRSVGTFVFELQSATAPPGLTVTPLSVNVAEGELGEDVSIALTVAPTGNVTVRVSAQEELAQKVSLSDTSLTFTTSNWGTVQTVTITAQDDENIVDELGTVSITASGGGYAGVSESVMVRVHDDDMGALTVTPQSLDLTEGGAGKELAVQLATFPEGDVSVSVSVSSELAQKVTVAPLSLTFPITNWVSAQVVTVTAQEDDDDVDDAGMIIFTGNGGGFVDALEGVPVTVEDDDAAELVVELDSLSVMEGGVGMMVEVSLGAQPTGTVAVAVSATGGLVGKVSFSPASLEYTVADWQVPQVVTVRADQDEDVEDESGVMELKATGGGYDGTVAQVLIAVSDDDMLVDMCYMTESERSAPPSDHMISASNEGYWMTSGIEILDTTGTAVQIKGVGLGGWLMPEGYMLHTPQASPREIEAGISELIGEAGAEEFWELYRQFYVREADVAAIKEWGFDHIRLPFHYNLFYDDESEMFDEAGFDLLDRFLEWCREHGLGVILDMHAAPGAQSEHNIADSDGEARLWTQPEIYWPIARRIWTEIARRYAEEKLIIGYDLLNEPVTPDGVDTALLGTYYRCLVPAVRKVDPHHIVFIEGNFFATDFGVIEEPFDPNMVYTFHKYWNAANQGTINYLLDLRNNAQRPLWLGETGENSNVWFAAVVKLMGDHNIGWNWWTHKKILTTTSPLSAPFAEGYQEVLEFWRGEGPRPTEEDARSALLGMARGLDIENSELRHGVLGSLFDPDFFRSRKPFREGEFITEHAIPGQIHAADYDLGGHGWTYFDTDYQAIDGRPGGGNSGASYRNDGVDIQVSKDPEGFRYNVGWTHQGEWLTYTVRVAEAGAYDIEARVASEAGGGAFRLILGGESIGEIEVASTGGWQDWESRYLRSVDLPAGQHEMRIYFTESDVNLNTLFFRPAENRTAVAAEEIPLDVEVTAVYPNPFGEEMNVEFRLPERGSVRAEMFDMLGRRVYETSDLSHDAGQHALPLRPGLVPGVYMLRLDIQMDQETVVILRPVTVVGSLR